MANSTSIILLDVKPLTSAQSQALEADVTPLAGVQPTLVLQAETKNAAVASSGLAADTDVWRVLLAPPSAMPDYVFLPLSLRANLLDSGANAGFTTMWDSRAAYAIRKCGQSNPAWTYMALGEYFNGYTGSTEFLSYNLVPDFGGYPPLPQRVTSATTANNALGGFQLKVATWDATSATATDLFVDAMFLGYRVSLDRNAAFWTSYRDFKPN